jgi:multiple sugar transport system ATP-binding protein
MIAGLEGISGGEMMIGGTLMNDVAPAHRGIAMVFQSYALYPHMSVRKNMAFALETAGMPRAEVTARVGKAAGILQIEALLDRKPKQLSGGQRQRVAIGRAIVRDPQIFLFDEPLSNLDAELRVQMRVEIAKLHRELGATMIYVTHDQVEAMTMADKIVVLRLGQVEQIGTPLELYNAPVNRFVAGFIGSPKMNFLSARLLRGSAAVSEVELAGQRLLVPRGLADVTSGPVELGLRPEHAVLSGGDIALGRMEVILVEHLGGSTLLYGKLADGQMLTVQVEDQARTHAGDSVEIFTQARRCHLFAEDGRAFTPV